MSASLDRRSLNVGTHTLVSSPASSSKSGNTQSHVTRSAVTTSHNSQSLLHATCCLYMVTNFTPCMSCGLATEEWGGRDPKWVSVVSDLISLIAARIWLTTQLKAVNCYLSINYTTHYLGLSCHHGVTQFWFTNVNKVGSCRCIAFGVGRQRGGGVVL